MLVVGSVKGKVPAFGNMCVCVFFWGGWVGRGVAVGCGKERNTKVAVSNS